MRHVVLSVLATVILLASHSAQTAEQPTAIDFAKDVLPILQRSCVECHGPQKQEGNLRLDSRAAAIQGGDSGAALIVGDADKSELLRRISLPKGHDEIMPARGEPLSAAQVKVLREWIQQGAKWPEGIRPARHWAYVKPARPTPPEVKNTAWPRNPIDHFVLHKLEGEGLGPSPEADPVTLVRRVYLDLIGLPPTPEEADRFVQSAILNPQSAIEDLVDELLSSPQFGVRWARPWLDYARYADSHGFQRDDLRDLWPYRDWVVDALNADMPFDQFTVEQLAGDLLPNATEAQRIATGFNRNPPTNVEAGSDPEETRVNQVFDRVNTLGMIWLGSSLECAQCHDHKYDPFTQRDYYGLFAFFNNTEIEADRASAMVPGSIRFLGPTMELKDEQISAQQTTLRSQLAIVTKQITERETATQPALAAWEKEFSAVTDEAPREHVLDIDDFDSLGGATHEVLSDKSVLVSGEAPDRDTYTVVVKTKLTGIRAIKLETLIDPSLPGSGPGRGDAQRPNFVLHSFTCTASPAAGEPQPVRFRGATADFSQKNFDAAGAIDDDPKTAWAINPEFHEPHWAVFDITEPVGFEGGTTFTFTLEQNFGGARTIGRLRLTAITGQAKSSVALPDDVAKALSTPATKRSAAQTKSLVTYRMRSDPEYVRLEKEQARLTALLKQVQLPQTLVMRELEQPRESAIFQRGNFRTRGESIGPTTPAVLHTFAAPSNHPEHGSITRLDLARWLVDRENPLVARVTVNRWWGELFGHGIVTTSEDFGIKGELPTHPELLDWLAVEFMEQGWSMKHVLRLIVTSATYRQSSRSTPELLARDDQNLLYARGPRFRLEAEMIRDNALAVAGVLSLKQGGPPIRPYQPDGLWIKVGGEKYDYITSPGDERFRRGLYVVLKRGAPYPSFVNFDANSRLACRVKRAKSNTPLQALTLMNDPVYVEIAKAFALRVLTDKPDASADEQLTYAFRLAVSRSPKANELITLSKLLESQLITSQNNDSNLKKLAADIKLPDGVSLVEFSAWYAVATALLNLDETISKS